MVAWAETEGFVQNGDVKLHYYAAGPEDGEPVLLLHGFPQFSYEWRYHLPKLAAQGYRVVAPDLRGYHLSDKPEAVEAYRMQNLILDLKAFFDTFGWQSANVVAHDWGGAVAWPLSIYYPQLVRRLVVLDIPHPLAFRSSMLTIEQIRNSWYIWFFQAAEVPERIMSQLLPEFFEYMMFSAVRPGTYTEEDKQQYLELFSQPGQLAAAINYYRANTTHATMYPTRPSKLPPLQMPVLLIHGQNDFAFTSLAWQETAQYCKGYYRSVELEGMSHWVVEEAPEETLRLIMEHLKIEAS